MITYKRLTRKLKKSIKKELGIDAYKKIIDKLRRTININFTSVKVEAKTEVLRASVTREMVEDINSFHEMSVSAEEYLMQSSNSQDLLK